MFMRILTIPYVYKKDDPGVSLWYRHIVVLLRALKGDQPVLQSSAAWNKPGGGGWGRNWVICVTKSSNGNCSVLWLLQSLEVWGHGDTSSASETGVERLLYPFTPLIYELKKELSIRTEERKGSIDYVKNSAKIQSCF